MNSSRRPGVRMSSIWLLAIPVLACTTTTRLRTFRDPSLRSVHMARVAVLPLRGTKLPPDVEGDLNRAATRRLAATNPNLEIIGPAQSQRLLEDAGLAGSYSRFARSSPTPGDIDMVGLKRISDALKTDAILQGDVWQIDRPNDGFFHHTVVAELTLRYSLIGLGNGELLWENSATVRKERMKSEDAPRIEDAIPRAQSLVLKDFPTLRQTRGPSAASRGASASFGCH